MNDWGRNFLSVSSNIRFRAVLITTFGLQRLRGRWFLASFAQKFAIQFWALKHLACCKYLTSKISEFEATSGKGQTYVFIVVLHVVHVATGMLPRPIYNVVGSFRIAFAIYDNLVHL